MVGPFIFFDHLGPAEFGPGEGIDVRAHPHIGLSTVTYLFEGGLHHKDDLGTDLVIEPGAVNWMTAGSGIVHSERTPDALRTSGHTIHAIQTWVALPEDLQEIDAAFVHHPADSLPTFDLGGASATLIAGAAWGHESPVEYPWPIWYLAVDSTDQAEFLVPGDAAEERAVYVCSGRAWIDEQIVDGGEMAVLNEGVAVSITMAPSTKLMLAGGAAMDGPRNIEWNLVSTDKGRIDKAFVDWQASIEAGFKDSYFSLPPDETEWIPTPER
ncbi:MAG: pirin family protein, partial [Pseudomonadota bacterium]